MAGKFDLNDYVQVNERITMFYKEHPEGSIQTEIVLNNETQIIIKASVYRNGEDKIPCTGHAMEKEGTSFINNTSHVENCETSAVGRALAMMGYEISKAVRSKEEMENAIKQQEELKQQEKLEIERIKLELISPAKISTIKNLILDTKTDEDQFFKHYNISSLSEITNDGFITAMKILQKKKETIENSKS